MSPKPDLFTKQPHGHCLDWENPVAVSSRLQRVGEIRLTHPLPVLRTGPAGEPAAATRRPAMCRIGIRLCQKAMPANAPHGIGKPTANRDLTPPATANGYRPADGWGVVNQAWRPGKTGNPINKNPGFVGRGQYSVILENQNADE